MFMKPHIRFAVAFITLVLLVPLPASFSADTDLNDIKVEITKRHDEAVKRLQDWIGQVSMAAEDRGYPEGAEYMAKLAHDAGFQHVTVRTRMANLACSRHSMRGRRKRSDFISCMT
jgi:hypothetical protein